MLRICLRVIRFNKDIVPEKAVKDGWLANQRSFKIHDDSSKAITGQTIRQLDADILALQEVEGLDTLKRFRSLYLGGIDLYPYAVLIDGNDPRRIDVAILSKLPIVHARTYQHLRYKQRYLFSRDCLEVDIDVGASHDLVLYVNHLKSMVGGRKKTRKRRIRQAKEVKRIVKTRFGNNAGDHPFVIVGDLNDYPQEDSNGTSGINALLDWAEVENVVDRLPPDQRWTHFYNRQKTYNQLDYVLLSKSLANANPNATPTIERRGLPYRAKRAGDSRFDGVNDVIDSKASDHCPVAIEITIV